MNEEYTLTVDDTVAVLNVLAGYIHDAVKAGDVDEEFLNHIRRVFDAFDNADRIVFVP